MAPLVSPWLSLGSPLAPPCVPLDPPWVPLGLPLGPLGSPLGVLGSPLAPLGSPLWLPSGPPFCSSSRRAHSAHNVGALLLLVISARAFCSSSWRAPSIYNLGVPIMLCNLSSFHDAYPLWFHDRSGRGRVSRTACLYVMSLVALSPGCSVLM